MDTAVALLLLLNDKCKPESLQRDGRPGWRFPQTAGCKARTCFVDTPYFVLPSSEDVNSSLSMLVTSFENVLNKHAPLKPLSKRQERIKSKPWLTKGLLQSIRTKNKLYTNLHKKSVQDDHKWAEFRKYTNKLNHLIEKSKVNYYMQQIASSNSSLMWKTMKNILNKGHKKQVHLQDLQNEDGTLTKSSKESADKINTYFLYLEKH